MSYLISFHRISSHRIASYDTKSLIATQNLPPGQQATVRSPRFKRVLTLLKRMQTSEGGGGGAEADKRQPKVHKLRGGVTVGIRLVAIAPPAFSCPVLSHLSSISRLSFLSYLPIHLHHRLNASHSPERLQHLRGAL